MALDTVFLVHGRNLALASAVTNTLEFIGARVLDFDETRRSPEFTGRYIGQVLDYAFSRAQAIVVILSPDDAVRIRSHFRLDEDPRFGIEYQPRPNVLIELGMALQSHPDRLVLLEFPPLRQINDIAGLLRVTYKDDMSAFAAELQSKLLQAGCTLRAQGDAPRKSELDRALQMPRHHRLWALARPVLVAGAFASIVAGTTFYVSRQVAACDGLCKMAHDDWIKGHQLWHKSNFGGGSDELYAQALEMFRFAQAKQPTNLRYRTSALATLNDLGHYPTVIKEAEDFVDSPEFLESNDGENKPWLLAEAFPLSISTVDSRCMRRMRQHKSV